MFFFEKSCNFWDVFCNIKVNALKYRSVNSEFTSSLFGGTEIYFISSLSGCSGYCFSSIYINDQNKTILMILLKSTWERSPDFVFNMTFACTDFYNKRQYYWLFTHDSQFLYWLIATLDLFHFHQWQGDQKGECPFNWEKHFLL